MKPRGEKGRLAPFVPLIKGTMDTAAWRATSHGARSLYTALKSRYNNRLGNAVYLSTQELGSHSHRDNIRRWFRELQYYGFIDMVSAGHLGVEGKGKAPHWRLTEEHHLGQSPTRDFLRWDGTPFHEQKSPKHYLSKKQNPGPPVRSTVDHPSGPVVDHPFRPVTLPSGPPVQAITSLTTPMLVECVGDGLDIPEFLRRA